MSRQSIARALATAEAVADRLDSRSPPDEDEVRAAIRGLREGAGAPGGVVGSRER